MHCIVPGQSYLSTQFITSLVSSSPPQEEMKMTIKIVSGIKMFFIVYTSK